MLDLFDLPSGTQADVKVFKANSVGSRIAWQTWCKPRGKTMAFMVCIGGGGNGGTGVIGANSTAAGGGGGGSGGQSTLLIPTLFLPEILYITVTVGIGVSQISLSPQNVVNSNVLIGPAGSSGGNASGATAGAAGAGATVNPLSSSCLAGMGLVSFLGGQAGIIGGATGAAGDLTLPTTGLVVTGGTGGGGLPAAAANGTKGGDFIVPAAPTSFPPQLGGAVQSVATNPANPGSNGFQGLYRLLYSYGGTGGSSTHGSASGGGLVQAGGGRGGPGSGGGGMGGALTGSTAAVGAALGGEAICIIISW